LIDYLVRGVTAEQAKAAAGFIDSLLSSARSKQELVTIWADAGADWFFGKDDIVPFLRQLRDRLLREQ
jgi:hypothetical protein